MKARPALSGLEIGEAMARVVEIDTEEDLLKHLQDNFASWHPTRENVTIEPYGWDERVGWDTHLVCVGGKAALFTDGPL